MASLSSQGLLEDDRFLFCPRDNCPQRRSFTDPLFFAKHCWTTEGCRAAFAPRFQQFFAEHNLAVCFTCRNVYRVSARSKGHAKCPLVNPKRGHAVGYDPVNIMSLADEFLAATIRGEACTQCFGEHTVGQPCEWDTLPDDILFRQVEQSIDRKNSQASAALGAAGEFCRRIHLARWIGVCLFIGLYR
jgi:hypothetical protein